MITPELALQVGITIFYTVIFAFFVIAPFRSKLRFSPKQTVLIAISTQEGIFTADVLLNF